MEVAILDLILTALAAGCITMICGLGVAALPWREVELRESTAAIGALGRWALGVARRPAPVAAAPPELVMVRSSGR